MEFLRPHLNKIRTPIPNEKIYKDECVFCFDTPESENGLFVCMNTFLGFGRNYVESHCRKTGSCVFLHLKTVKREIPKEAGKDDKQKPTRLAIGLEGGFDINEGKKYEYEEFNSITILPDFIEISLPNPDLPDVVQLAVASILSAESASKMEEALSLAGTWDGEMRKISKHADNLLQLDNNVKIAPTGWKCSRCDKTDNLWLNLTDGVISCGRKFFDGSGGNNHAMAHYQETSYPLVVKLGTITPNGADVYSYDEDDMVEDPNLGQHLAHFGINIAQMEKTDKSMVELEIDMNQRIGEWAILQEADSQLVPVYGAGYTGLSNLGNSCYLNSVMQVIFTIPDFQHRYFDSAKVIFNSAPKDPAEDFNVQLAKLGYGLLSGDYSKPPSDPEKARDFNESQAGIKPCMFKNLIGKGHPEFSTKRQQDAQEFFLHLINLLERNNRNQVNPAECFKYEVEERIECMESKKVKYTTRIDFLLPLPIPMDEAINKDEIALYEGKMGEKAARGEKLDPAEVVRARIPMQSCIEAFTDGEIVDDFFSSALNKKTRALKKTRLRTFPDYLLVQLKKFTIGSDWVPRKLDVSIDVPDILDLSSARGHGRQPGEEELPEIKPAEKPFEPDPVALSQLVEMGFPVDACRSSLCVTNNSGVEAAMNWIMEHMGDPDFPSIVEQHYGSQGAQESQVVANEEAVASITSMGFTTNEAIKALKAVDNNVERAIDWIFSHSDELQAAQSDSSSALGAPSQSNCRDGLERYQLVAFISHMGTSTLVGHYVCHILKDNRWVIFNDNKVAFSEHPPKDLAYLYLYRRITS